MNNSPEPLPADSELGLPPILRNLLLAPGPSGYEQLPSAVWREAAAGFAEVSTDAVGTPLALVAAKGAEAGQQGDKARQQGAEARQQGAEPRQRGAEPRQRGAEPRQDGAEPPRRLLVMGHIDEIGLIVTHIDDDGYLWFAEVGGWDPQILVGQRVVLEARDGAVRGVVGKKPIHLLRSEERKKVAEIRELHIDIGAADGDEAREHVRVGDVAVIHANPTELLGGRLASRALDNRIGSYVALEAARLVAEAGGAEWEFAAVAATQEETTLGGSRTSAFSLAPDAAIVLDVTHATDAPGIEVKEIGKHPLGSGPVLSRGSTLNPRVFELLHETAEAEGIPFTIEASGRATGTDADAVHLSRGGVPTGLVSIPLRYMHSPVELVQLEDVENAARLVAAFALRLNAESSFPR